MNHRMLSLSEWSDSGEWTGARQHAEIAAFITLLDMIEINAAISTLPLSERLDED